VLIPGSSEAAEAKKIQNLQLIDFLQSFSLDYGDMTIQGVFYWTAPAVTGNVHHSPRQSKAFQCSSLTLCLNVMAPGVHSLVRSASRV